MFKKLTDYFHAVQETMRLNKNHAEQAKLMGNHIRTLSDLKLASCIANLEEPQKFWHVHGHQLINTAIHYGSLTAFKEIFSAMGSDPNYTLRDSIFMPGMGGSYSTTSMLYEAITSNNEPVALFLASNPDTNILWSGEYVSNIGKAPRKVTVYSLPLEAARKSKMTSVIPVLAERVANLKQDEVNALRAEARILSPV